MFTKAERKLLKELLQGENKLMALDYDYQEDNEKSFKEYHGISFKRAEKLFDNIISKLIKI